ncbi:Alcohol dehydrogenase superfamily zinc-containing [Macrophomina phaseolina MS6]|uniref:Alcohol dehydrogenase superfamily zinc-containing n=1 Tax=Macrophomina phaseolina (strain MS6) TaxID=1126212 RepID=K2S1Q9_MACPH|nr:Alcohol dehydrogenase superfamily zinc-containing [Macrophomina phaseolina MS6]
MRGVLWEGIPYQMTVANIPVPNIQAETDAIVRVTASAICGTDLHTYHGVYGSPNVPWTMGHEAIGYISELGDAVSSLSVGEYVVVPDQLSSGHLEMEPQAGTALGLGTTYGLNDGCQAEYVRVPFADDSLIPVPIPANTTAGNATNEIDYLFVSDIFATGWHAIDFTGFEPGDTVAVFGAGPVGLLAAYSAILRGASAVYAVDHVQERLDLAASIGAVPINFVDEDPVAAILRHEPSGVRRAADCVGAEALGADLQPHQNVIVHQMVAVTGVRGGIGQVGIMSATADSPGTPLGHNLSPNITFPTSEFFNKGLSYRAGAVDPKELAPQLVELIATGKARPSFIVSREIGIEEAPEYYERFDRKEESKVIIRFP